MCNPGSALTVQYGGSFAASSSFGAGRNIDQYWPGAWQLATGSPLNNQMVGRNGIQSFNSSISITGVGGPAANFAGNYKGVSCAVQPVTAVPAFAIYRFGSGAMPINPATQRLAANSGLLPSPYAAWLMEWIVSTTVNPAQVNLETGNYCLNAGGAATGTLSGANGFGFRWSSGGAPATLLWTVRGPNGLVETTISTAFDFTNWHIFGIIIVAATLTSDAFLIPLVDNKIVSGLVPALSTRWGAGTNLPDNSQVGGLAGFQPIWNTNLLAVGSPVLQVYNVAAAPSLAALF